MIYPSSGDTSAECGAASVYCGANAYSASTVCGENCYIILWMACLKVVNYLDIRWTKGFIVHVYFIFM